MKGASHTLSISIDFYIGSLFSLFGGVGSYGLFSLRIVKMILYILRATAPTAVK